MIYLLSDCGRYLAAKYKKKGALSMERRNAWKVYDQTELEKLDKINKRKLPSDCAPGTQIHTLINKLKPYLTDM